MYQEFKELYEAVERMRTYQRSNAKSMIYQRERANNEAKVDELLALFKTKSDSIKNSSQSASI